MSATDRRPPRPPRLRGLPAGVTLRRAGERDATIKDWLDSRHTFAFGTYDRVWGGLGALKVLNEDVIAPGDGFGPHPHWDMEIVTWVVDGALLHEDSLGHRAVIPAGGAQRVTAGTGVEHAERNASHDAPVRLFQIWIAPATTGLPPGHQELAALPPPDRDGLVRVASREGDGGLTIHQDAAIDLGALAPGERRALGLRRGRRGYLHVVDGALALGPHALVAGDGAALVDHAALDPAAVELAAGPDGARFLRFDLP